MNGIDNTPDYSNGLVAPFVNPAETPTPPPREMSAAFAQRMLAFVSGTHETLGAESPVSMLTPELLRIVTAYARPPAIVTGSQDRTARVWDLETGRCVAVCRGHRNAVLCVAASASRVYTGSADTTVRVWDANTGACTLVLRDSKHHVMALSVLRDTETLVCGSKDGHLYVYHMFTGELRHTVSAGGPVFTLAYDEVARVLVVGLGTGVIERFDTRTWERVGKPINAHAAVVAAVRVFPAPAAGGRRYAVSVSNFPAGVVSVWDADTWDRVANTEFGRRATVTDASIAEYTHNGQTRLLVTTDNGDVLEFDPPTGKQLRAITPPWHMPPTRCFVVAPTRDVDLGAAWYADEAYIQRYLTPEVRPISTKEEEQLKQRSNSCQADAELEHTQEEEDTAQQIRAAWPEALLGPCPPQRFARPLAVGQENGTCSVYDYPRGSLVFTLPAK